MTVLELMLKLEDMPNEAKVIFVSGRDDNILTDYYEVDGIVYIKDQRNNTSFICIMPT